jgi:iron complex transport system substrate-binding protein
MHSLPRWSLLVAGLVFLVVAQVIAEISVVDDLNRRVTLPFIPHRIISLAPSITETLFAVGAGDRVIGVTDFCNYPPEATRKQRVGGMTNPSIETIVSLKPDLIILSMEGNAREDFNKLLGMGVPLFATNPRSLIGIHKSIRDLGLLTDNSESASRLVETMMLREDSVRSLASLTKQVLLIVSLQPLIVVGNKTFLAELVTLAGGVNIVGSSLTTFPTLSREAVVAANPEVIMVMSDVLTDTNGLQKFFPEWSTLRALRTHQVFRISSDLVARPGPRAVDGLVHLYKVIQQGRE